MTNTLQIGKRALHIGVAVSTIAWSIGLATFIVPLTAKAAALSSGDLIKASLPAVYYYGGDGKRYVFPNEKTYKTWYSDFSTVKTVTDAELAAVTIGGNATYRPGVKMVKITTDPKVYAVAKGGVLRHVASEAVATSLYGANWNTQIDDVPDAFFTNYTVGSAVSSASDFDKAAQMDSATTINSDKGLAEGGAGGGALQVSAASDSPAGGSIVADSDNDTNGSSQRAVVLKMRFASSGAAAKVTKLLVRRTGITADSDIDALYLYDGDTRLTQNQSLSQGVATFENTSGLFTVPAGGSKDVTLKMDIDNNTTSGKTVAWSLASADVTSDASSVSGSAVGNQFTVASVTDLGYVEVANVSPGAATTVDPQDNFELWRFKFDANDQNMLVKRVTLTNVGSVDSDDLQNIKLMDGATQLGATAAQLGDGKLALDLSGMADGGLKMLSGTTKQLSLRGDIKGGTNRTYRFSVQNTTDIVAWDLNYNVETVLASDSAAFTVTQAGGATTINTGSLTIQIHPDAPAGNVPDGATNVLLAKWNLTAAGEDVQVDTLDTSCNSSDTTNNLDNIKLTLGGSQVGTTQSTDDCDDTSETGTDFSFGNTFTIAAGTTKVLEYRADLTDATVAGGETLSAALVAGSSNAKGRTSLTAISTSAVSGRTVTVGSGLLTVTKNTSLASYTSARPLGVPGLTGVRIGSFVITGGAEESDITGVTLKDDVDTTSDTVTLADYFINMKLKKGTTQLGTTVGTLTDTDSTTYEFTVSPSLRVGIGEQIVIDVYADIKSTTAAVSNVNTDDVNGEVIADKVTATGVTTSTDTSYTTDVSLQDLFIATKGMLRVTSVSGDPAASQLTLGSSEQVFAKFKLAEESNAEDILVTKLVVADDMTTNTAVPFNSTGTLKNVKLWNGSTLLGSLASLDTTTYNTSVPLAVFDLTGLSGGGLIVPKGGNLTLTVKADLTPFADGGQSSSTHRLFVMGGASTTVHDSAAEGSPCGRTLAGDATVGSTGDWDCATSGFNDAVEATGKGSGIKITQGGATATAGLIIGPTTGTTGGGAKAVVFDVLKSKLTVAHASDAPSGLQTKSSEATVAKFVFTNTSPGGYTITLKQLNLDVNSSGISLPIGGTRAVMNIYKETVDAANLLATTTMNHTGGGFAQDTQLTEGNLTDLEIAGNSSRTVIVTLDTSNSDIGANDTLSVGIQTGATGGQSPVQWSDEYITNLTDVDSLPLVGKTLSY
ncbi:hypothetical protein HYT45_02150 [Candidatus Uhrbacteria bacterium]|nr:hypothetical protein [Candidatus Uhrbacteria bacterium]